MKPRRIAAWATLAAAIVFALIPIVRGSVELPTAQHHALHAALLVVAVAAGILFVDRSATTDSPNVLWLIAAMIAPILAMLLMWPSEYTFFETHPYGHALEHAGLVALGFFTAFAGERYARGIGWATGLSLLLMAFLAVGGFGTAPSPTPR